MPERCERTELFVDQCAHCRGVPPPETLELNPYTFGPWFPARYDGECTECGVDFAAGDEIRSDGFGGWLCGDCGSAHGGPS